MIILCRAGFRGLAEVGRGFCLRGVPAPAHGPPPSLFWEIFDVRSAPKIFPPHRKFPRPMGRGFLRWAGKFSGGGKGMNLALELQIPDSALRYSTTALNHALLLGQKMLEVQWGKHFYLKC